MAKKKYGKQKLIHFKPDTLERVKRAAQKLGKNTSQIVRDAVEQYVEGKTKQ